jgi:hypothetical protein
VGRTSVTLGCGGAALVLRRFIAAIPAKILAPMRKNCLTKQEASLKKATKFWNART